MITVKYVVTDSKGNEVGTFTDANEADAHDKKIAAMEKIMAVISTIPAMAALDERMQEDIAMALVDRKEDVEKALAACTGKKTRKPRKPREVPVVAPTVNPSGTSGEPSSSDAGAHGNDPALTPAS